MVKLSLSNTMEYYLWLDSKYNVRRCDVVQNKTNSQSKSFRT